MSTASSLTAQILALASAEQWPAGTHLPAQQLADRLQVSRQPIAAAMLQLEEQGLVQREHNRGYFWRSGPEDVAANHAARTVAADTNLVDAAYLQIAEDRLAGELPETVTETLLRNRYQLSRAQLSMVLGRIAHEGWIERKPGYGWRFAAMLTTPESLLQSYRLRLALEPAALLEPGYRWEPAVSQRLRAAELHLLAGGICSDDTQRLHERGVNFHEALVAASGNPFFIDAIRRVNRVRRLLSYRSTQDRSRYQEHCEQHLRVLDLLDQGRQPEAAAALREHLHCTLANLQKIVAIL